MATNRKRTACVAAVLAVAFASLAARAEVTQVDGGFVPGLTCGDDIEVNGRNAQLGPAAADPRLSNSRVRVTCGVLIAGPPYYVTIQYRHNIFLNELNGTNYVDVVVATVPDHCTGGSCYQEDFNPFTNSWVNVQGNNAVGFSSDSDCQTPPT